MSTKVTQKRIIDETEEAALTAWAARTGAGVLPRGSSVSVGDSDSGGAFATVTVPTLPMMSPRGPIHLEPLTGYFYLWVKDDKVFVEAQNIVVYGGSTATIERGAAFMAAFSGIMTETQAAVAKVLKMQVAP